MSLKYSLIALFMIYTEIMCAFELTFKTFEFPSKIFEWNSVSVVLAATVRIQGETLQAVPGKIEFPTEAEMRIFF